MGRYSTGSSVFSSVGLAFICSINHMVFKTKATWEHLHQSWSTTKDLKQYQASGLCVLWDAYSKASCVMTREKLE